MNHVSVSVKIRAKNYYSWNSSTYICDNGEYLKSIVVDSKIVCDEIVNATDNVTTSASTNFYNKKVKCKKDFYMRHEVLLAIILLFIIALFCRI